MLKQFYQIFLFIMVLIIMSQNAAGKDLTIGTQSEPSIDPHFLYLSTNIAYSKHIFGRLVDRDENGRRIPDLAVSWNAIDDNTWEFKLRKGVKFHDGSEFTAQDVVFSFERIPSLPNNPGSYANSISGIVSTEIIDPHTIIIKTDKPNPVLPSQLHNAAIVSKKHAAHAGSNDFASGKAAIGTGPYKFVKYIPGDRLVLERFEDYWGNKPAYKNVTFRIISNDAVRTAALLGGDIDMIDNVPPASVKLLEKKGVSVFKHPSDRVIFLTCDTVRDQSPFVTDKDGNPMEKNPLKDIRVRKAIAKSIHHKALTQGVMEGLAIPANQLIPEGWFSYNPDIKSEEYDPQGAAELLKEAGYPDGFGLTIHGTNNRYVNDAKVCQAVAQMLSRIGIKMKVETLPKSVFFSQMPFPKQAYSFWLLGWGNAGVGESSKGLLTVVHSFDKQKGTGTYNGGCYNPRLDILAEKAAATVDEAQREILLKEAMAVAMNDYNPIPLYTQYSLMAAKKGITVTPRADEQTLAMNARPSE
ncbi:Extracellular solute-binding protein, family 5 [Desulfonema limicola]|uniref:Extracellular solute-binding protein, family 5 n=1 Tax=Desulfonema limicola TaxID=45656 RepID=A0A975BCM1_9BACT|nr:ABC transporter substrate-binding protein [Desulfonema limicola]QTA82911.1 Extracellular solute-binding protein, family 5 [Desulfonema limicola]